MNKILLFLFCCSISVPLKAQDNNFAFDQPFYKFENSYVILPDNGGYVYGLMIVSKVQGFKFLHIGSFTLDGLGKAKNTFDEKFKSYPLPSYVLVAPLPERLYKEFGLERYSRLEEEYMNEMKAETVNDLVVRGMWYVKAGGYEPGIAILQQAYAKEPHADILEMYLGLAYNDTKQYDKAIDVLKKAVAHDPAKYTCWQFLGQAYHSKGNYAEGDNAYKKAIEFAEQDYKKELGFMVTNFYYEKKDKQKVAEWTKITKQYLTEDHNYYDTLLLMEKNMNK